MVLQELGNAAYKNKNFDEAIRLYDLASEKDGTDMSFLTNRAAVLFEQALPCPLSTMSTHARAHARSLSHARTPALARTHGST